MGFPIPCISFIIELKNIQLLLRLFQVLIFKKFSIYYILYLYYTVHSCISIVYTVKIRKKFSTFFSGEKLLISKIINFEKKLCGIVHTTRYQFSQFSRIYIIIFPVFLRKTFFVKQILTL